MISVDEVELLPAGGSHFRLCNGCLVEVDLFEVIERESYPLQLDQQAHRDSCEAPTSGLPTVRSLDCTRAFLTIYRIATCN